MLKINKIEFIKVVYDDSLSHNIFSIANILFKNAPPIYGALLYWRKNDSFELHTSEDEYKYIYRMAKTEYYAAVKYPKNCSLTTIQRRELAFVLLEERSFEGSYSVSSNARKIKKTAKKAFEALQLPKTVLHEELSTLQRNSLDYWRKTYIQEHPSSLGELIHQFEFDELCKLNPHLSEQLLIDYLDKIDIPKLFQNVKVLSRLSKCFKSYMVNYVNDFDLVHKQSQIDDIEDFIESDYYFSEVIEIPPAVPDFTTHGLDTIAFDLGDNIWQGAEHLNSGIPSLRSRQYDQYGYKKFTNEEMDQRLKRYDETQLYLFSAIADLHWLNRFADQVNWEAICKFNPHLTESFIIAHEKYIDYKLLGLNSKIVVSDQFISNHFDKFDHHAPVPLIICNLNEQLFLRYKDQFIMNEDLLFKYSDAFDEYEYILLNNLL